MWGEGCQRGKPAASRFSICLLRKCKWIHSHHVWNEELLLGLCHFGVSGFHCEALDDERRWSALSGINNGENVHERQKRYCRREACLHIDSVNVKICQGCSKRQPGLVWRVLLISLPRVWSCTSDSLHRWKTMTNKATWQNWIHRLVSSTQPVLLHAQDTAPSLFTKDHQ